MKRSPMFAFLALLALGACGRPIEGLSLRSGAVDRGSASLSFSGTISDGLATNARVHTFHSTYVLPATASGEELSVTLRLLDATGKELWTKTQVGAELDWSLYLTGAEGEYKLVAEPKALTSAAIEPALPWRASFTLDASQPALAATASLGPVDANGDRKLNIALKISGEKASSCDAPLLTLPGQANPVSVAFDEPAATPGVAFTVRDHVLHGVGNGNITMHLRCVDAAKNPVELIEPVGLESRQYSMVVTTKQALGAAPGTTDLVHFVQPGTATVQVGLLDKATASPIAGAALSAEASLLRLYVTTAAPAGPEDLADGKPIVWTQIFDASMSFPLPSGAVGRKKLYVSATRRQPTTGGEELVGIVPLDFYIAATAPVVTLRPNTAVVAAAKDKLISVVAEVTDAEAPIDGVLTLQQSVDNLTWTDLASTSSTTKEGGRRIDTLTFAYPFVGEAALRVRAVAKDIAGYRVESAASGMLVSRGDVDLAVTPTERAACPGSLLKFWLASSSTCKQNDVNGQPAGSPQVTLLAQNRGSASPTFYSTTEITAGFGYQVWVDGVRAYAGRYDPPTAYAVAPGAVALRLFELNPSWLAGKKIEVLFDDEATDVNSTTNACYPNATPFSAVIIKDEDRGLKLDTSPFPCDTPRIL